jgi:hypothetical protein
MKFPSVNSELFIFFCGCFLVITTSACVAQQAQLKLLQRQEAYRARTIQNPIPPSTQSKTETIEGSTRRLQVAESDVPSNERIAKKYKDDGTVTCRKSSAYSAEIFCTETGIVDGWHYTLYADHSGHLSKSRERDHSDPLDRGVWKVGCDTDKMTDMRSCYGLREGLFISLSDKGMIAINVIGTKQNKFEPVMLRIDKNEPSKSDRTGWVGTEAAAMLVDLLKANKVTTRYKNLYGIGIDNVMVPDGIVQMLDILRFSLGLRSEELPKLKA